MLRVEAVVSFPWVEAVVSFPWAEAGFSFDAATGAVSALRDLVVLLEAVLPISDFLITAIWNTLSS
jgi:hypothetical protein